LEATAIQVILAGKPVKTLAANFCLPALWSERTCPPVSVVGWRSCWLVTWTLNMWTGL
jgi:predicted exporter